MFFTISVLLYLGSIIQFTEGSSKSRCAVVIFVNQSSFKSAADLTDYVENIRGLSTDRTSVYFSEQPDLFKVRHGLFIQAPGLFALESQKNPGKYLRRANHTIVLEDEQSNDEFKNDATFLMDHVERNESYTTLKLFSHRSWKLSEPPNTQAPLFFRDHTDSTTPSKTSELLVVAQPCPENDDVKQPVVKSSKPEPKIKSTSFKSGPRIGNIHQGGNHVTEMPPLPTDAVLNGNDKTKYLTAITNQGKWKTIPNEYSFNNYEVPSFVMNSLIENAKTASDGVETPGPGTNQASIVTNKSPPQQPITEHNNLSPTTKQKISELSSLISDPDIDDIENNLKDLQYGSKGCKLLVAEDTMEENAAFKDSVAQPKSKKECLDEFPEACLEMAKKGYCLAFKSLMSSVCRKSCNLCSRLLDTGFTSCTKTCGGGRQMRMIKINRREYLQTRRCNAHPCPINGGYSEYGPYTECSVTCGEGVKYRRRTCTHPRPKFNGKSCRRLGPSIESKPCNGHPCPNKDSDRKKPRNKEKTKKIHHSHKQKAALHIDGPHSSEVHHHSILLKGKKVANLRCTPKSGELKSVIQDSPTKRFTIHHLRNNSVDKSKKSNVEESEIVYNHEGLPVDTAKTVVKAFKSPYKIILARKGHNNMKLLEECVQVEDEMRKNDETSYTEGKHHGGNLIYTRPNEKSYSDFNEYKFETGNIATPEVTVSHNDEDHDDYSSPLSEKLFDEPKGFDDILSKLNSISPRINDQLSQEQNLENSIKMEAARPVDAMAFTGEENNDEREGVDTSSNKDNYEYDVQSVPEAKR
ncbi:uncharacterized protein LOC114519183 [Dendronephthya gigantea]|uniref:uncharacterized protein LOC114519183 n=1 Tax=Dendronephthya gigantea TaxID=151771 RepID=UPI00106C4688|nr:uncharacterized protein LOC114519183 [Dendronephthya gigantea]XP_028395070.1 uncharacterized protein LOC114519183 [Dendronephthya gigantea]